MRRRCARSEGVSFGRGRREVYGVFFLWKELTKLARKVLKWSTSIGSPGGRSGSVLELGFEVRDGKNSALVLWPWRTLVKTELIRSATLIASCQVEGFASWT